MVYTNDLEYIFKRDIKKNKIVQKDYVKKVTNKLEIYSRKRYNYDREICKIFIILKIFCIKFYRWRAKE